MPPVDSTTGSVCFPRSFSALADQRAGILPVQRRPTLAVGRRCMLRLTRISMFPFFSLSITDWFPLHRGAFHNAQRTSLETGPEYSCRTGQSTYFSEGETAGVPRARSPHGAKPVVRQSLAAGAGMTRKPGSVRSWKGRWGSSSCCKCHSKPCWPESGPFDRDQWRHRIRCCCYRLLQRCAAATGSANPSRKRKLGRPLRTQASFARGGGICGCYYFPDSVLDQSNFVGLEQTKKMWMI
jgi:hypothetical protein